MKVEQKDRFRVIESPASGDKLIFVFTAMGTKLEYYRWFLKSLNKHGYSVIAYDYPTSLVLEAHFDEWVSLYESVADHGVRKIAEYTQRGTQHFYAYGVSMGTLLANKFARETPDISHLIISLTYGDVTDHIMSSPATKKTRKAMIKNNIPVEYLRERAEVFDPTIHAEGLVGKKVMLHLSRQDRVLDYDKTKLTKKAFEDAGVDMVYQESRLLGHYAAGAKHMIQIKKIDKFLQS